MTTTTLTNKTNTRFSEAASDAEVHITKDSLEAKGFSVKVVDNLVDANKVVKKLIPLGSEVFTATSVTLEKAKLNEELNSDKYVSVRNKFMALYGEADKAVEMRRIGSGADYAVGSVHAITEDGQVVIASASGSQLPNYAYGASHVIWVVGSQKIVKDLEEGIARIENHSYPLEDIRAQEAYGINSSINEILILRKDPNNRATIIIVKEPVGF